VSRLQDCFHHRRRPLTACRSCQAGAAAERRRTRPATSATTPPTAPRATQSPAPGLPHDCWGLLATAFADHHLASVACLAHLAAVLLLHGAQAVADSGQGGQLWSCWQHPRATCCRTMLHHGIRQEKVHRQAGCRPRPVAQPPPQQGPRCPSGQSPPSALPASALNRLPATRPGEVREFSTTSTPPATAKVAGKARCPGTCHHRGHPQGAQQAALGGAAGSGTPRWHPRPVQHLQCCQAQHHQQQHAPARARPASLPATAPSAIWAVMNTVGMLEAASKLRQAAAWPPLSVGGDRASSLSRHLRPGQTQPGQAAGRCQAAAIADRPCPATSLPGAPGSPGYMPRTLSTSLKLMPTGCHLQTHTMTCWKTLKPNWPEGTRLLKEPGGLGTSLSGSHLLLVVCCWSLCGHQLCTEAAACIGPQQPCSPGKPCPAFWWEIAESCRSPRIPLPHLPMQAAPASLASAVRLPRSATGQQAGWPGSAAATSPGASRALL